MSEAMYLVDTSALIRLLRNPGILEQWDRAVENGHIATCTVTELELLYTCRSHADRERQEALIRKLFGWVVMPDRVFQRATELQAALSENGAQRSAGVVDLLTAVTAQEHGYTLLHYDRDFDSVAEVTGQPVRWIAEPGSVN